MKIYRKVQSRPNRLDGGGGPLFIGIDMHLRNWFVTIMQDDRLLFSNSIPGTAESLLRLLDPYRGHPMHACYEAGYFGFWLHDALVAFGATCIVVPPSLIPQETGNRVKTDRIDSKKLAILLSKGLLKAVYVPTAQQRSDREILRRRIQLVRDRVEVQLRIKALLRLYNLPFPEVIGKWSRLFVERLHGIRIEDRGVNVAFRSLLKQFDYVSEQIDEQTKLIYELAHTDPYREKVQLLRTVPGIGLLIAMELLLELQDFRRFPSAAKLAAYVGLTPAQSSSGEHIHLGRITRMGKAHLRAMLVEASWIVISKDPLLAKTYERLKHRCGAKRAIVAIARRLVVRLRRIVLDGVPYRTGQAA